MTDTTRCANCGKGFAPDYPEDVICDACFMAQRDTQAIYGETEVHTTVEAFAKATGLTVEVIRAHSITSYHSATGVPLHRLSREVA